MLEDDGDGEGDEIKLFESTMKLLDKALTYPKLQDLEQFVLFMECVDANQILNSNATTHVNGNLKLLDEVKPQIGFSFKIKFASNVEGQGHAKVQFEINEINNIKEVFYMLGVNKNILFIGKIINKGHLTIFNSSQHLIIS